MNPENLLKACADNDWTAIDELLENGTSVNATGDIWYPPSWFYPNGLLVHQTTPLLEALANNHLLLAKSLLRKGANLYHITQEGFQASHLAAYRWSDHALYWLICEKNFSPQKKNNQKINIFEMARRSGLAEAVGLKRRDAVCMMELSTSRWGQKDLCDDSFARELLYFWLNAQKIF